MTYILTRILTGLIRGYQLFLSPLLPPHCRFSPTCSQYMLLSIEKHGVLRGVIFGIKRIIKCHPFHAGGYDPVK